MFKRLYAYLTGTPLVYVNFGHGHELRLVRRTQFGAPYVLLYGQVSVQDDYRKWVPVMNCELSRNGKVM